PLFPSTTLFRSVLGVGVRNRCWALVMQGHTSPGIQLVREGVASVAATGARLVRPSYLAMLAAADAIEGNRDSAAQHYDEALAEVERTGERLHEAGLLIGRTQVLAFGRGPASESEMAETESYLRKAHAVAVAQGARLFELRASLALARLSSARGGADAERVLVEQAYACFAGTRIAAPEVVGAIQLLAGDRG